MTPLKPKLPPNVDIHNQWYQYRHRVPLVERTSSTLQFDAWGRCPRVKLCPVSDGYDKMLIILGQVKQSIAMQANEQHLTLGWLHAKWKAHIPAGKGAGSRAYKGLAPSTQRRYDTAAAILDHEIKLNGVPATLKQARADLLDTITIRTILDKRFLSGETSANLNNQLALLGSMYKFGKQYLVELKDTRSPTRGIEKFSVQKRTRYVTDNDYKIQYNIAGELDLQHIQDYMELTYLCAARSVEIASIKIGQATKKGIIVIRKKGSLNTGIHWNDRLKKAWDRALSRHNTTHPRPDHNLIVDTNGHQISQSTIHDHWGRVRTEMKKRGLDTVYFTAQNLKVKGIKDADDKAKAGQTEQMQRYYQDTDTEVEWFD